MHERISREVFVSGRTETIFHKGVIQSDGWLFDFRRVILDHDFAHAAARLFFDRFRTPVQICGIEVAAIPLVSAFVMGSSLYASYSANGFFIRKSRKKDGLARMIEGTIADDVPIVVVDDLMNTGSSLIRQVEVIESLGKKVSAVWTILRFRDESFYEYFHTKGIPIYSLFSLNDFENTLSIKNLIKKSPVAPTTNTFSVLWKHISGKPNYIHVVVKSGIAIDDNSLYFGSDSGVFFCLDQKTGNSRWTFTTGRHNAGKGIFSTPYLYNKTVFFGAYDGNVYALDSETGKRRWISFEADWVGSSPTIASELGLLFIGLEFGLVRKRGGIIALDIQNGKKVWSYTMPSFTHASPLYIPGHTQVAIGSNDGCMYLFNAKTGTLVWKYKSGDPTPQEIASGFSPFDIKDAPAYHAQYDTLYFGNINGDCIALDRKTGNQKWHFKAEFGIFGRPVIFENKILFSSLDKTLYCLDANSGSMLWQWFGKARIFSSPAVIETPEGTHIYIGTNTGRISMLSLDGKDKEYITLTERITNPVVYNPKTQTFFFQTYANEVYAAQRKEAPKNKNTI